MSQHDQPLNDRSIKVAHLVFGLLFLGVAGLWALIAGGAVTSDGVTILAPSVLIAAGVMGLVATLASSRNRSSRPPHQPYEQGDLREDLTEEIR